MACCKHPVERHAYNGCANCGCSMRWPEHPDRDQDESIEGLSELERRRKKSCMRANPRTIVSKLATQGIVHRTAIICAINDDITDLRSSIRYADRWMHKLGLLAQHRRALRQAAIEKDLLRFQALGRNVLRTDAEHAEMVHLQLSLKARGRSLLLPQAPVCTGFNLEPSKAKVLYSPYYSTVWPKLSEQAGGLKPGQLSRLSDPVVPMNRAARRTLARAGYYDPTRQNPQDK